MQVNNKKIAKILLKVILLILDAYFAPKLAVKTLVEDINKTIKIFTYPIEYSGRFSWFAPVIIKIITLIVVVVIIIVTRNRCETNDP